MPSRRLLFTFLVLVFLTLQSVCPQIPVHDGNDGIETGLDLGSSISPDDVVDFQRIDNSLSSADPMSGVLDPVTVEQYGYSSTGFLGASTDSGKNEQCSIPIDNTTGWVGSQAELELWNMKRLYVDNGTFDDGVSGTNYYPNTPSSHPYGWSFDWDDTSAGTQNVSTSYEKDDGYIVLESKGELATPGGAVEYRHYDGTYIYWNQTVSNVPYSDNLTLSFMYYYDSGIISNGTYAIDGWMWLDILINGAYVDYIDLITECPSKNTWIEFTISNITDAPSILDLQIGLYVMTMYVSDDYFVTYPGADYDGDKELDYGLAQTHRIFIDNVSLLAVDQPSYDAVDLAFIAGSFSTPITEFSNYGTAVISNPSYWSEEMLSVGISSNVSITCDYEVTLLSHNYGESLRVTQPGETGVAYTIDTGGSASLTTFMYIGSEGVAIYENFTVELYLPPDWENTTIYDPFLNDVTSQCIFTSGSLEIPTSLLDRLGWWQITLQSPNYAKSVTPQIRIAASWFDNTLFRSGNITRASVELGTQTQTPSISDPVNITWHQPDESIWYSETVSSGVGGVVETSQRTLLGSTTIAGEWTIDAWWTNGTEIAYGSVLFDMYHTASLDVPDEYEIVNVEQGLLISNFVYFEDVDTSEFLLDDSVTIEANWSGSVIPFTQDFVKNWWRGEFDTSLIEGGQYSVVITASRPYFDDVSVQFTVICTLETTLDITNAGGIPIERGLNEVFTVQMDYDLLNGTGIDGASIDVSHIGPGGGLEWSNFVKSGGKGHYSVDIICDISATYLVTITLNKTYHYSSSDTFTLTIGETGTELELLNGTSGVVQYGDSYRLVVEYRNSTGGGLTGATLEVVTVTPSIGLTVGSFTHIADGYYEITFTPTTTGTYAIVISADLFNHETQYATFTLTGVVIPTVLTSIPSSASIAVNDTFVLQLSFEDESANPINSATIELIDAPSGITISNALPVGNGLYNISIRSLEMDIYNLLFRASATNYQSSIVGFTVSVTALHTTLDITNAGTIPVENGLNEVFTVQLSYELLNGTGVPGALPIFIFSGPAEGLTSYNFVDSSNGLYSIDIICNVSATYGITITMSKPYYYNTTDSFTLIIGETGTSLSSLNGTADMILFGGNFTVVLEYLNSTSDGLSGATLTVEAVTPSTGLTLTGFTPLGNGLYSITLTPDEAGTFSVVMSASLLNHETQYVTFTITATGLPTVLTSSPSSASIAVDQNFTVQLQFQDESLNPIDSATVVIVNPPVGILISDVVPLGGGLYNFTLTPLKKGSFDLLFRASSDNYQSSSTAFTLSATQIPTRLEFAGGVSSTLVEFQDLYHLTVYYYRSDTPVPLNVDGANLSVLVQDPGLVINITEYVGYYVITIMGEAIGSWSLTISANKTDHHLATRQFLFTVEEIPVLIEVDQGLLQGAEGFVIPFTVNITSDTGDPIINATVFYDIRTSDGTPYGDRVFMHESSPGTYIASLDMPSADGIFYIKISCKALNFGIDETLSMQLQPRRDIATMFIISVRQFSFIYIGIGSLVIGLVYRRRARKNRIRENKATLAIKHRFDDIKSLMGVIVLHKDSGLPVYSKILRDGLEEVVISAFITAITSFRGEFDIESSSEEWGLIPISDIIRVISTNKLVCAFITTGNPSPAQRERMIQFAKTVGFIFDDTMEDVPIVVLDHHTTQQFDSLFEDLLDGQLLRTYKLDDIKKFPTTSCANERIARKQGEEFKLEELATEIASCGLEEGRVYKAIMDALENEFLVTTDDSPFATELLRAPDTVEEEG